VGTNVQSFAVANLCRRPVAVEAGGFVAGFDPGTTSPYINYATPLPGAEPTHRDVETLIAAFRTRGLRPRLEFAPDAAPDGGCAGGASCSAPAVGTSELSGVGTRPTLRGRGIATAVTAALTEAMFALGTRSVWLEYSGEGSRRVYERVGYHPQGTRLYMSLEE
jgi:RimJ/RimL family protein N-acetyltransferase